MVKKTLLAFLALVVVIAAGGFAYLYLRHPAQRQPLEIKVSMSPDRIARGKYLFETIGDCGDCHTPRDFTRVAGPDIAGKRGQGTILSNMMLGLPGTVVAPNLTPDPDTGIGLWSDGEKIRAIRDGVDKSGRALFPIMPYTSFRNMSDNDVQALVAYLDSLPAIKNPLPVTHINFPVNLMIKSAPQPAGSVPAANPADKLKYGKYLVDIGGCADCHTPVSHGQPIMSKAFSGGQVFETTAGKVTSSNITPELDTGIGKWSEPYFLKKFNDYKDYALNGPPPASGPKAFTLMPWLHFSLMTQDDLSAIYTYLRTVPAIKNYVDPHQ
ncbi:MAG TPA: cytochrome c [Candidatus Limnocylindrales bacterium]|nr:cytochrome c [Candidatus Limnocylindrales bacterium]